MFRTLMQSTLIFVISVFLILLVPIDIIATKSNSGPSPYRERINELYEITAKGLHPSAPEFGELDLLVEKNNIWHEQKKSNSEGFINAVNIKSTSISPILALLWAFSYYVFFRKIVSNKSIVFLSAPAFFTIYGGFSLLAFSLILFGVLVSFILIKLTRKRC